MKRTMQAAPGRPPQKAAPAASRSGAGEGGAVSWLCHPAFHLLLLLLLGVAAYANTFHSPFVFDDMTSIVENGVIKDLGKFLDGAGYAYNPRRFVGYLTLALNYRFGGLNVAGYHAVNLAIHLASSLLLYGLVLLLFRTPFFAGRGNDPATASPDNPVAARLVALFTALLFVAHPVQTQAVTYIVQRLASLTALFYLLALVSYLKGRIGDEAAGKRLTARGMLWYVLALGCAVLALRTKENAYTLPLIVLLIEFSFFRGGMARRLIVVVPAVLAAGATLYVALGSGKPLGIWLSDVTEKLTASDNTTRGEYLINQFRVVTTYIRLLFLPVNQNLDYDYPFYQSLFEPAVFCSFLFLLALLGLAIYLYRRAGVPPHSSLLTPHSSRLIAFGIFWFFITLLVESSIIPIADHIFEHRLYLPAAGLFLAVAALAFQGANRLSPRLVICAMAVAVLVLAAATWKRNQVWGSEISLWSDVVEKSPGKVRGHFNLGAAFNKADRLDEAIEQLEAALAATKEFDYDPPYLAKLNDYIGVVYNKKGMVDQAYERLRTAVSLDGGNANARSNLALVLGKKGLLDQSIEQALIAERLKPDLAEPYKNLGTAYLVKGRLPEAASQLEKAIALDPRLAEARNNLGIVYLRMGKGGKAVAEFQSALRLKPERADFKENLAAALAPQTQR
jgi:protein O-mannosyl-transferase